MIVTQIYADRLLSEFRFKLLELNRTEILTIQGILNGYIYCAALNDKRITRSLNGRMRFKSSDIADFFRGDRRVVCPVTWFRDYLRTYWAGLTYTSRDAIADTRKRLCEHFKIFTLEDRHEFWKDPLNRHRQSNPCGEFNMLRAIMLARACEEHLLTYGMELEALQLNIETAGNGHYEYDRIEDKSFPTHKAYFLAIVGKAAGLWTDSEQIHPDLHGIVEMEGLRMNAEHQFEQIDPGDDDDRPDSEILEEEMLAVTEIEVVTAQFGVSTIVERVVDAIPLVYLVRRSMLIPPAPRPLFDSEGGIRLPAWVRTPRDQSVRWWQRAIDRAGSWLLDFAPEWAIDRLVPF